LFEFWTIGIGELRSSVAIEFEIGLANLLHQPPQRFLLQRRQDKSAGSAKVAIRIPAANGRICSDAYDLIRYAQKQTNDAKRGSILTSERVTKFDSAAPERE
jgi:hypothetical protein